MANLLNQNIRGTNNYKGILNLGSSIGTPLPGAGSAMIYITDGTGANLPIQVAADKLRFDVNVGIGGDPSASYGLWVQSSSGTVLANRYHFAADRYLDSNGVVLPTGGTHTVTINSVNHFQVNATRVLANNSIGFGTAGTPPAIGATLLGTTFASNGEYVRLFSGHNSSFATASYTFFATDRTFSTAPTGSVASIIDIPSHIFGISNAASKTINYRGLSLAYTINNTLPAINVSSGLTVGETYIILTVGTTNYTAIGAASNTVGLVFTATGAGSGTGTVAVAATGFASGIRIDATLTNLNGMVNRGFMYNVNGVSSNTRTIGIQLTNPAAATSGNQQFSPSIILEGNGWKTNATAASQKITYEIYLAPVQAASNPVPQLNFDTLFNDGTALARNTVFSVGGTTGITYNPQVPGLNPLITMGVVTLSFAGNAFNATVGGPTTFNPNAFILTSISAWTNTSTDRAGFNMNISFAPTSGNANFSAFVYSGTINQTGGANGITRGLWVAPLIGATVNVSSGLTVGQRYTIASIGTTDFTLIGASSNTVGVVFVATGAGSGTGTVTIGTAPDFRAIDVEQGRVFLKNLRTTAGSPGELWNDGGTIKIS
jgi:hypothetical protein